ncbi:hypothetical protein ACQEVI_17920 [Promicromonospora sp. CA-289599]|uniref:hypothetical protein n=1 Tax=Promicromonospora sp. CA-289599 TaxID=3240014 RepID=UPI003D8BDB04
MEKNLICTGFAKAGTTLLHVALGDSPSFEVPTRRKEIKYFFGDRPSRADYVGQFTGRSDQTRVLFEASPQYMTGSRDDQRRAAYEHMSELVPDAKFLVCLRQPTERAFSHYIHNLMHFARFGTMAFQMKTERRVVDNPYARDFEMAFDHESNLNVDMAASLKELIDTFGRERVKLYFIERDGHDFGTFYRSLCGWLGIPDDGAYAVGDAPRVHESGGAPVMLYGGSEGRIDRGVRLDKGQIVVVAHGYTRVIDDVTEEEARRMRAASRKWTLHMGASQMESFYEDYQRGTTERLMELVSDYFPDEKNVPRYDSWEFKGKTVREHSIDVSAIQQVVDSRRGK